MHVNMPKYDLIVLGHLMKETIIFTDKQIGPVLGSPAAYSSVSASILGARTGIVTIIGDDMQSSLISPLEEAGVDSLGLRIKDCSTRTATLTYDSLGNKTISYKDVAPAILYEDIPKEYLTSSAFFICPLDFEVPIETICSLKENTNGLFMTDLGGYGGTVSTFQPAIGHSDQGKNLKNIVNAFDIVKASMEDCQYLFHELVSHQEALGNFLKWGAKIAIITLSQEGLMMSNGEGVVKIPAFKTEALDSTGAGDVFCAAFIVEFLRTKDPYLSALYGSAAASVLIEKTGGVRVSRMPTDQIIRERLMRSKH